MTLESWRWHLNRHLGKARPGFSCLILRWAFVGKHWLTISSILSQHSNEYEQHVWSFLHLHPNWCNGTGTLRDGLYLASFDVFCCRSPWWSILLHRPRLKKSFCFPTSSTRLQWVWHLAMQNHCTLFKNLAPHKCQSETQAYAVMKQNKK